MGVLIIGTHVCMRCFGGWRYVIRIERSDCSVTPILAKQSHSECPELDCDSEVFILIRRFPQLMRLSDFWGFYPNTKVSSAYEIVRFWQCDDLVWGYFSSVWIDLLAWGYFSSAVLRERERYNFRRWYQWVVSSVKIVTQLWMRSLHWGRVLSNATVIDTALVAMYW